MKSVKQLSEDALLVQDACNLSGVVHGFSRAMTDLREALPNLSTEERNHHPIAVMWASKIASLTACENGDLFARSYEQVREWAEKP